MRFSTALRLLDLPLNIWRDVQVAAWPESAERETDNHRLDNDPKHDSFHEAPWLQASLL